MILQILKVIALIHANSVMKNDHGPVLTCGDKMSGKI